LKRKGISVTASVLIMIISNACDGGDGHTQTPPRRACVSQRDRKPKRVRGAGRLRGRKGRGGSAPRHLAAGPRPAASQLVVLVALLVRRRQRRRRRLPPDPQLLQELHLNASVMMQQQQQQQPRNPAAAMLSAEQASRPRAAHAHAHTQRERQPEPELGREREREGEGERERERCARLHGVRLTCAAGPAAERPVLGRSSAG
jgi:hypothetical protein